MIDLGVLDTLIAMVVVILLLSMIVQSIQGFAKKLMKFKSAQIEKSLAHLFDQVNASSPPPAGASATAATVLDEFRKMGRENYRGKKIVESISKADLSKVVISIEGSSLVPDKAKVSITAFFKVLQNAQQAADALAKVKLSDAAVAKLTELRTRLTPYLVHLESLFDQQGALDPKAVVRDVLSLRDFPSQDVLKIANELQAQVEQASAAAPDNPDLQAAATAARNLARAIGEVSVSLSQTVARLRERIDAIETWYDTVMQGFEERYARHMRTWAFVISLAVAVILNADVVQLYKRLATDDVAKQRILAQSKTIQDQYDARMQAEQTKQPPDPKTIQDLKKGLDTQLNEAALSYPALGLEPFNYDGLRWYSPLGWLLMALLLSLGAPFWQDTLESLFAFKNLLRQKGQIQKVEQKSGEGATKT